MIGLLRFQLLHHLVVACVHFLQFVFLLQEGPETTAGNGEVIVTSILTTAQGNSRCWELFILIFVVVQSTQDFVIPLRFLTLHHNDGGTTSFQFIIVTCLCFTQKTIDTVLE